jgi:hypothetical protein
MPTDRQIEEAIATLLGWKRETHGGLVIWIAPCKHYHEFVYHPPNYCTDKNSHAALFEYLHTNQFMQPRDLEEWFLKHLLDCYLPLKEYSRYQMMVAVTANPRRVCEAFLRAVDKWQPA